MSRSTVTTPARGAKSARTGRPAKSSKADGTPKKRWSPAERAERGHTARRSGGRPRTASDETRPGAPYTTDRTPRSDDRDRAPRSTDWAPRSNDRDRAPRSSDRDRAPRSNDWAPRSNDRDRAPRSNDWAPRSNDRDRAPRSNEPPRHRTRTTDFTPRTPVRERQIARAEAPVDLPVTPAASIPTAASFGELGVPASLVSALTAQGITAPFAIQAATIPDAIAGRDVLGRGQTGSGKTLAFGLPMLANLAGSAHGAPRGIVLVPTRELAMQVLDALTPLARIVDLSMVLVAGGMSYTPQLRAFSRGVDLVVATPGRLIDLIEQGVVDLSRVEVTVLDEADHMADLGFMPAVTQILDLVPTGGQRLLFSATLDRGVDQLVKRYLHDPVTHEVDSGQASVTTMTHYVLPVAPNEKAPLTAELANRSGRTVVFVRTQRGADRVAEQLREAGVMAGALHGGLPQGARTRIMTAFKDTQVPVLVATDVAARGIHVDDVSLVLQVDPPAGPKEYLHRAGRTARAGGVGVVVTLVLPHQRREVSSLTTQAGVRPATLPGRSQDPALVAATGATTPSGQPITESAYQQVISPAPQRRRGARDARPRNRDRGPAQSSGRSRRASGPGR